MRYELVPAVDEDRSWLEQLRRSVYRDLFFATWGNWDETRHLRHCDECWARGSIYVVEIEGARVGMMQLFEHPDATEVGEIQIAPAYQNQGIGTRLLRDTIARAHTDGRKVVLSTGLQNHRAFQLYLRLGFRHTGQTDTHNLAGVRAAMIEDSPVSVCQAHNKQLERTIIRRCGRAASASFHCAHAARWTARRTAAQLRR